MYEIADLPEWYSDTYTALKGPDNFLCVLTEPEDRNWYRDLKDVVKRLNKQHQKIEEQELLIQQQKDEIEALKDTINYYKVQCEVNNV